LCQRSAIAGKLEAGAQERFDALMREGLAARVPTFFRWFYRKHGRAFHWRERGVAAFGILVAEMLLHQTRAEQVAAIWPELMDRYPAPSDMAHADPGELYALLVPLGLGRQRVEALISASAALVTRHHGKVPKSLEALATIPHLGLYAANATACFAYGKRVPVVDANVLRVFSRLFGETYSPDNRRAPIAWERATSALPPRGPVREHNYGLLDFAALICKAGPPRCHECQLNSVCTWCKEHVWDKRERLPNGTLVPPTWPVQPKLGRGRKIPLSA